MREMKQLKFPSSEDYHRLETEVEFTPEEKEYWEDMKKRIESQYDKEDFYGRISFYNQELQAVEGKFGDRIAVKRRLNYHLGHAHEWLGSKVLKGHEPLERAEMLEKAVLYYHAADETIGYYSDYAIRQGESCLGVSHFRMEAGLEDRTTVSFYERGMNLVSNFIGKLTGARVTILPRPIEWK